MDNLVRLLGLAGIRARLTGRIAHPTNAFVCGEIFDMNRARSLCRLMYCVALICALLTSTGCRGPWSKGWKVSDMWSMDATPWGKDAEEAQTPERLLGSWTDTMLYTNGKTAQRGFGGRVIFYGKDPEKPILVDGQLVVYAFDETNREPTDNKPTRRYVFPADQVARRMSETSLGPSYSFWLPWDEAGGPQAEVSLVARFEPVAGALIVGEQTRHILPGASTPSMIASRIAPKLPEGVPSVPANPSLASLAERARASAAASGVQQASYDEATGQPLSPLAEEPQEPQRRMTTTSISLPENFRITSSGAPQTVRASEPVLPGNVIAQPAAPPPNYNAVAAPISVPQPGAYPGVNTMQRLQQMPQAPMAAPGYMTLRQSPLGNGFVAPLGPPNVAQHAMPATVGQMGLPQAAPVMPGQAPLTTAGGWTTTTYSGPAPTVGYRTEAVPPTAGQPSSGYPPQTRPAPSAPAVR